MIKDLNNMSPTYLIGHDLNTNEPLFRAILESSYVEADPMEDADEIGCEFGPSDYDDLEEEYEDLLMAYDEQEELIQDILEDNEMYHDLLYNISKYSTNPCVVRACKIALSMGEENE